MVLDTHDFWSVLLNGILGGSANALTMIVTNPLDVLKIRSQTAGELVSWPRPPISVLAKDILRVEGVSGLFKGLSISMIRELTFSSARLGLYEPIKSIISQTGSRTDLSLPGKIVAGVVSGAAASTLFNPTDVIKGKFVFVRSRHCGISHSLFPSSLHALVI